MEKVIKGYVVLIDPEDEHFLYKYPWFILKRGHLRHLATRVATERAYFHRKIMDITDSALIVDHVNGNGLDNRKENLRIANKSTNGMNRSKNKNNKSGYKGVSLSGKKWVAEIMFKGKRIRQSGFATAIEAAKFYNEMALLHHKEFAFLNKLDDN